ncbi:hypothetical protein K3495_g6254 [Podosphaera aphanis]|nr:hypothetical protein K3495_g6254 [Podosphaera aphanis]
MYGNQKSRDAEKGHASVVFHDLDSYSKSLALLQSLSSFDPTKPSQDENQSTSNNYHVDILNPTKTLSVIHTEKPAQDHQQRLGSSATSINYLLSEKRSPLSSKNCPDFSPARSTPSSESPSQSPLSQVLELGSREPSPVAALAEKRGPQNIQQRDPELGCQSQDQNTQSEEPESGCQSQDQNTQSEEPESGCQSQDQNTQSEEPESGCQSQDQNTQSEEPESGCQSQDQNTQSGEPKSGCQSEDQSVQSRGGDSEGSEEEDDLLDRELETWGPLEDDERSSRDPLDDNHHGTAPSSQQIREDIVSEARLAGILPIAALFRRPSAASRKYTRKPISKLFISLDLTAEAFFKLQAAAKSYMLDERHPERREAIGTKRRAENDMGKLKLYCFVKHFLEEEGWGERCFGLEAERVYEGKYKWPESKKKIIQLVTPLMRRMVTNERQRQYAIKTRMSKKRLINPQNHDQNNESANLLVPTPADATHLSPNPFQPLNLVSRLFPNRVQSNVIPEADITASCNRGAETNQSQEPEGSLPKFHINLLQAGRRLRKISLLTCPTLSGLVRHVVEVLEYPQQKVGNIQVLVPFGLVPVFNEESWTNAMALINKHEWMDNEIRCLVNLETPEVINLDTPSLVSVNSPVSVDLRTLD